MLDSLTAEQIINLIKHRKVSIKEVVEYYLDRIERINPKLNSIILQKDRDLILKEATEKDNLKKIDNIICGMPIAIKDLSDVVGYKTTYGFPGSKNNFPKKNSLYVDKLINNGAIIIGKTNTAELGVGGHTINRLFGPTSNVYDFSKSSGGSSGGASSAVAADLLPFADGTDQMGSCRGPAAYANIYGFRPTIGLIAVDRTAQNIDLPILTTPGCFAKTPNDLSIFLDSIVGSNLLDKFSFDLNDNFVNQNIKDKDFYNFKIGWLSNMDDNYLIEKNILKICENKLRDLEKLKLKIELINNELDSEILWRSWVIFRSKSIYEDTLNMNIRDINSMTTQAIWEYNKGKEIKSDLIKEAYQLRANCINQINKLFDKFDFLAMPSAQISAFDKNIQFPAKINGIKLDTYHRWMEVFVLSSLLYLPTITIPVGFDKNGLPMGMQLIGKQRDDFKLLSFAKKYEEIFNFSKIKPKIN